MALIKILLFYSTAFTLSGFDFIQVDNPVFNEVFLEKQILWNVTTYAPELLNNKDFQKELADFITVEKDSLFLKINSSKVRIPKYFMRAKVKNGKSYDFEIGFIFTNNTGSLWSSFGKIKNLALFSNQTKLPSECINIPPTKLAFAYFEYDKAALKCSRFSLYFSGHPLGVFQLQKDSNKSEKPSFYLSPKALYPGVILHGLPEVYFTLRKKWRLSISRFTDRKDHSIIYFP